MKMCLKVFVLLLDTVNVLGENVQIFGFSTSVAMKANIMPEQNDEIFVTNRGFCHVFYLFSY